jgi:hypothetical protein
MVEKDKRICSNCKQPIDKIGYIRVVFMNNLGEIRLCLCSKCYKIRDELCYMEYKRRIKERTEKKIDTSIRLKGI